MALTCTCQIEADSGHEASSAAKALVLTNLGFILTLLDLTPLVNCRVFSKILVNLSKRKDPDVFKLWLSDEFNAYTEFFTNLNTAFADWRPYENTADVSDFHIPRFLNLKIDQKRLSSAVEQFFTTSTIEISKSVRNLPNEYFVYLESALLDTVLHASPVVSVVAQDIWCFVVRSVAMSYGSAELCWQYVVLLGNTVLCLAEKYSSTPQTSHPPLEQMSRLGGLLSRFLIFLTARQQLFLANFIYPQREFLSTFPLFDCVGGGMTEKSLLWRFLLLSQGTSQLQPSIRPLLEKQVLERVNYLLRSRSALTSANAATNWLLDALTCLRLTEDLTSSTLVPSAPLLAQLCIAALTFDESEILPMVVDSEESEGVPVAPPYLFHLMDPSARLEFLLGLFAHWLPRKILLLASEQSDSEFEKLLKVLFTQLRTWCRNGFSLPTLDVISSWILGASTDSLTHQSPLLSSFTLVSSTSISQLSTQLSSAVSQALSSLWSPLCQTELTSGCELICEIVKKLKFKIHDLCPDLKRKQKRPLESDSPEIEDRKDEDINSSTVSDVHFRALADVIRKLEANADVLTPSQRSLGSALTRRLNALFESI
ncbi:unnamed protein product [Hymenolepis diminuta]|uniref:Uncharacterized protein n=1 Tax=Hymenolepis diminuta TaxID=6216 RepID=A0A0R3SAV7_HYMDI|nr:unnamed protein product [Hymenolepis diminuta]